MPKVTLTRVSTYRVVSKYNGKPVVAFWTNPDEENLDDLLRYDGGFIHKDQPGLVHIVKARFGSRGSNTGVPTFDRWSSHGYKLVEESGPSTSALLNQA